MVSKIKGIKNFVVKQWTTRGITDIFVAFALGSAWDYHSNIFFVQGLEKICKAHILGKRSIEYEKLVGEKVIIKICGIAKEYNHSIVKMVGEIDKQEIKNLAKNNFEGYNGLKLLELFPKISEESRYPGTPNPSSNSFPVENYVGMYFDPTGSSAVEHLTFYLSRKIIERIRNDFSIVITKKELRTALSKKFNITRDVRSRFSNVARLFQK